MKIDLSKPNISVITPILLNLGINLENSDYQLYLKKLLR